MVRLFNLSMQYGAGGTALQDVSCSLDPGEFAYLTGPSGAGKSTLLKLLFAEELPSRGQVLVDGVNISRIERKNIPFLRRKIGIVFQDFKLIPGRTLLENVALPLVVQGAATAEVSKRAYMALKRVGLAEKRERFPLELSGGEQQRAAFARAMVAEPKLILADEPTGNLDEASAELLLNYLHDAHAEGATVLMATHSHQLIERFPHRVLRLERGKLVADTALAQGELL